MKLAPLTLAVLAASASAQAQFTLSRSVNLQSFSLPTSGSLEDVVLADLDNDADLDVLVAGSSGNNLLLNGGSNAGFGASYGTFTPVAPVLLAFSPLTGFSFFLSDQAIAAVDLERDGDVDLIVGSSGIGSPSLRVWRNRLIDTGTFKFDFDVQGSIMLPSGLESPSDIEIADFDLDGLPDVLVSCDNRFVGPFGSPGVDFVLINRQGFLKPPVALGPGSDTHGAAVGDVDGNGTIDILLADSVAGLRLVLNTGAGTFAAPVTLPQPAGALSVEDATPADFDGDGRLDIVVSNGLGRSYALRNTAAGFVVTLLPNVGATSAGSASVADFDGDGNLDCVTGPLSGLTNLFEHFAGGPGFAFTAASATRIENPATGFDIRAMEVGDVDRDGDIDLLMADAFNGLQLFVNLSFQLDAPASVFGQCSSGALNLNIPFSVFHDIGFGPTTSPSDLVITFSTVALIEPRITVPGILGLIGVNSNNALMTLTGPTAIANGGTISTTTLLATGTFPCGFDLFHQAAYLDLTTGTIRVSNVVKTFIQ